MESLHLYCRYISLSIQSQMQYRASFVMLAIANFVTSFVEFFSTVALFGRFGTLRGWSLPEVALFYGIVHIAFSISEGAGRGFDVVHRYVRSGNFDRMLLRPRSIVLQILGQDFQMLRVGRLVQGTAVLLWAAASLKVAWTLSSVALVFLAIIGGAALFTGLFVLQATISFWSVDSIQVANNVTYGGVEAVQFPLPIYRKWLREFFIFIVPLATINYFPALTILNRADPLGYPSWLSWASPIIGVAFLFLTLQIFNFGIRHYHSTGS